MSAPDTAPATTLVILEFTGLGSAHSFTSALPRRPPHRTLTIDPLDLGIDPEAGLADRAQAVAAHIGPIDSRLALLASCSGAYLLPPLAEALCRGQVEVAAAIAVDPAPVTDAAVTRALAQLGEGLGVGDGRALEDQCPEGFAETRTVLATWVEQFIEHEQLPEGEQEILREELLDRYLGWLAYLAESSRATWTGRPLDATVLTVHGETDLSRIFGSGAELSRQGYTFDGRPGLTRPDLAEELRLRLAGFGWPAP